MPTFSYTKTYADTTTLTEAELDAAFDSVKTFLNTTKLDTDNLQTGAVLEANLGTGAVTEAKIGAGAVTTTKLGDLSVSSAKIQLGAVTTGQIASACINSSHLSSGCVTSTAIADGTITGTDIASATIAAANLASGAALGNLAAASVGASLLATNLDLNGKAVRESGANIVVSNANATNSLSILRGAVNSGGSVTIGEGFTAARTGVGAYTLTFSSAFGDLPAVTVSPYGIAKVSAVLNSVTTTSITVAIYGDGGNVADTALDSDFMFVAIGQRT